MPPEIPPPGVVWCAGGNLRFSKRVRSRKIKIVIPVVAILVGSICLTAQQTKPPDDDHAKPPREQRKTLDEYTRAVSAHLPAEPLTAVHKKNYIDDYIFGKIAQDRIPHAGLSSDT